MGSATDRMLVFRLAGVGFTVNLDAVVEVVEQVAGLLDRGRHDLSADIVGALYFRRTWIPAIDPTLRLELTSETVATEKVALVLSGPEGNWAVLVDAVVGIHPVGKFSPAMLSPLLKAFMGHKLAHIDLLEGEPLVRFVPEHYYGSVVADR